MTIVTAVFNARRTLPDCLTSVARQSQVAEHVIVDGGSTDGTLSFLRGWKDHPLTIVSERDAGLYDALNKGIARATGEVIGLLHADDYYAATDVLKRVATVFDDPAVDACYGDLVYVGGAATAEPRGEVIDRSASGDLLEKEGQLCLPGERVVRVWRAEQGTARSFYQGWMPPHPTFFVRRRVYERVGQFRLDLGSAADYEFMLRAMVKHAIRVVYLPGLLVKMRVGGVSNASLRNRLRANRMDRRAWKVNGLRPYPWTLWFKPLRKLTQWRLPKRAIGP